jgi:hypothetical protein
MAHLYLTKVAFMRGSTLNDVIFNVMADGNAEAELIAQRYVENNFTDAERVRPIYAFPIITRESIQ